MENELLNLLSNGNDMPNDTARSIDELQRHAEHIKRQEYAAANTLLAGAKNGPDGLAISSLGNFAIEAYSRVADMFCWSDFNCCRNFVMVGCGPLPVTLLHVADKYPGMRICGLDIDQKSLEVAQQVVGVFGLPHVELFHNDGASYVYSEASIIYVANLVYPKSAVLKQISDTGCTGALIILRDPTESGAHLADVGIKAIDERYRIQGVGRVSHLFQSRHIFLRLMDRNKT